MNTLKQVVNLITQKRLRKFELLNDIVSKSNENLYYQLYQGIRKKSIETDVDAAKVLYGTNPLDKKYLMLKGRFTKRLLSALFFLDPERHSTSKYNRVYYQCHKDLFIIKILRFYGVRVLAVKMAKKLLRNSLNYQFYDVVIHAAEVLRYYASFYGDVGSFDENNKILVNALRNYHAELQSDYLFRSINVRFNKSVRIRRELAGLAKKNTMELRNLVLKHDSNILEFNMYRVWYLSHQLSQEFEATINICTKAEEFLKSKPDFNQNIKQAELALTKMECYTRLGDVRNGFKYAERCLHYFGAKTVNRLIFLQYYFILTMVDSNYTAALEVYEKAQAHPLFENAPPEIIEKWKISSAYLNYMSLLQDDDELQKKNKFKLEKFINEVPIYSKDKSGYNVSILILQLLFLLERGDFSGIMDRMDALKIYRSRYLRSAGDFRSNNFVKMLLIMERKDFDYEKTRRMAMKYLLSMQEKLDQKGGAISDLEVIPYEDLWARVLETLQRYSSK